MPASATFASLDPLTGAPVTVPNTPINFGWEYVWHCHILSHEEMDMMRPVSLAVPPLVPDGLAVSVDSTDKQVLAWNDNSINETSFLVQRSDDGTTWADVGTSDSPLDQPNTHGRRSLVDPGADPAQAYRYRVIARNSVGLGGQFPEMTVKSTSAVLTTTATPVPNALTATQVAGPAVDLRWSDNATTETGFVVQRSTDNGTTWTVAGTLPAQAGTGPVAYSDSGVTAGQTYTYRVAAQNGAVLAWSARVSVPIVAAPTGVTATVLAGPTRVRLSWTDVATNETGYRIERSTGTGAWSQIGTTGPPAAGFGTFTDPGVVLGTTYQYRVSAVAGASVAEAPAIVVPVAVPLVPTGVAGVATAVSATVQSVTVAWNDTVNESGYTVQWSYNGVGVVGTATTSQNTATWTGNTARRDVYVRVRAGNALGNSAYSGWALVRRA